MAHLSYEQSKKRVYFGFWLLFGVTILEVFISLLGKGHIVDGLGNLNWFLYILMFFIVVLSLYKAYFIVYDFMHMKHEAKDLRLTVIMPTLLLVWAIIAFFQEGNSWLERRDRIKQVDEIQTDESITPQGVLEKSTTKKLDDHDDGHH